MNLDEMEAGRAMDALVAEKVFGWTRVTMPEPVEAPPTTAFTVYIDMGGREYFRTPEGHARYWGQVWPFGTEFTLPEYSTDIAAAWLVVERLTADRCIVRVTYEAWRSRWECAIGRDPEGWRSSVAPTAPLAICRAALKAVADA